MLQHAQKIQIIQNTLRSLQSPVALDYGNIHSNTTRTKNYKNSCTKIDCSDLNRVIQIDVENQLAFVEPRVTMMQLVEKTVEYGLMPAVVPEFKGITIGGAIMGAAAESSSHLWGIFTDSCTSYELIGGNGDLFHTSKDDHPELFHAIPGSYGSFGLLTMAQIKLQPAKPYVHIQYLRFNSPLEALSSIEEKLSQEHRPDFIDGIIFAKNDAVVILGWLCDTITAPWHTFSKATWYHQYVQSLKTDHECMGLVDYLFRYDQGAFWMGSYLFHFSLLRKFITEGIYSISKPTESFFNKNEIAQFHHIPQPGYLLRNIASKWMGSSCLWKLLHRAECWVQNRFCIQDFCIPQSNASRFLTDVLQDPGIYPLWLCPIKATHNPQIFAPHLKTTKDDYFINFGMYGLPNYSAPMKQLTSKLEDKTTSLQGRKVLYSHSYYSEEQFWKIYPQKTYQELRIKTHAPHVWLDITEKVLSD